MTDKGSPSVPSWTWPESATDGQPSWPASHPAQGRAELEPASQPSQSLERMPGESGRSFQVRSTLLVVATSLLTTAISFGVKISDEQAVAIIGLVTAVSSLFALAFSGRRRA